LTERGIEIFSHEESLDQRINYRLPQSINTFIQDINFKNRQQLQSQSQSLRRDLVKAMRRKGK